MKSLTYKAPLITFFLFSCSEKPIVELPITTTSTKALEHFIKVANEEKIVGICILPVVNKKFCLMSGWRHQFDTNILQAPAGFLEYRKKTPYFCLK